jgi:hypothetical protein|tara:strand:+ start:4324 stop:4575 length:252 start_codon:yes stop_codon:yes gene_type:complete
MKDLKKLTLETTYKNNNIMTLKIKYNQLLEREKKASAYFDNPNITNDEKDKHIPNYFKIIKEMDDIWNVVNDKEADMLKGFEL